jgi:predicted metalloendopeptidase
VRELHHSFAPGRMKAQDDFYTYVNYRWLKDKTVDKSQKYIVQVDEFRLSQDRVYHQLEEIVKDRLRDGPHDAFHTRLSNFYHSVLAMTPESHAKKLCQKALQTLDQKLQQGNPWEMLAFFNQNEISSPHAPFSFQIIPDDKDPQTNRCNLAPHEFFLIDTTVYEQEAEEAEEEAREVIRRESKEDRKVRRYRTHLKNEFIQYVQRVFDTSLGKGHGFHAADVFMIEVEMFKALKRSEKGKFPISEDYYNRVPGHQALSLYGFDWDTYTRALGFKTPPPFFITGDLNIFAEFSKLLTERWKSWRTYWVFLWLRKIARFTKEWHHLPYEFYGKTERGQQEIEATHVFVANFLSLPFNSFFTREYVKRYENPEVIRYVQTMCDDMKIVFRRLLERCDWMSPSTKAYAYKKLDHFKIVLGHPPNVAASDPELDYPASNTLYENMETIFAWRHEQLLKDEGQGLRDLPVMDWTEYPVKMVGSQAYIVNASYTPSANTIYINLGYLQKPFVDLDERGIEYNLAHIGNTIAHEMSHGFDDMGSQFGWDGKLHNWWTAEDKRRYALIQYDVVRQYEEFAARDGIDFDASVGLGEDLADISAVAICNEYLSDYQQKNEDIIPIRNLSFEGFYTYFAYQQKQILGKSALKAQLKNNPHPLDKYRCNIPLSRSDIFRAMYNVKKGDGMWWWTTNSVW